jgi:hypothetical protein
MDTTEIVIYEEDDSPLTPEEWDNMPADLRDIIASVGYAGDKNSRAWDDDYYS